MANKRNILKDDEPQVSDLLFDKSEQTVRLKGDDDNYSKLHGGLQDTKLNSDKVLLSDDPLEKKIANKNHGRLTKRDKAKIAAQIGAVSLSADNNDSDVGDDVFSNSIRKNANTNRQIRSTIFSMLRHRKNENDLSENKKTKRSARNSQLLQERARKAQRKKAKATNRAVSRVQRKKSKAVKQAISNSENKSAEEQEASATNIAKKVRPNVMPPLALPAAGGALVLFLIPVVFVFLLIFGVIGMSQTSDWNLDGLNPYERQVAIYLKDKGLDKLHAAAIMGNLARETSGPTRNADTMNPNKTQVAGMVGGGIGIMQWGYGVDGGRGNEMETWAISQGKTWNDLSVQLDWMWAEMVNEGNAKNQTSWYNPNTSPAQYERFTSTNVLATAVAFWENWMEKAGTPVMDERVALAQEYLSIFNRGGGGNSSVVDIALDQIGKPYVWGASGPDSFDCSGLVFWAYSNAGYDIGRTTAQGYYNMSTIIAQASAQPGDLVFFGSSTSNITHIGIYIGEGQMVEAPYTGATVRISSVNRSNLIGFGVLNV